MTCDFTVSLTNATNLVIEDVEERALKVAVVRILMSRANTLSSSGVQRLEEEKKIVDALKENGYLSRFIRKHSCPTRHRQEVDARI